MGNCIQKDSDKEWGGDYWGSPESSPETAFLSRQPSRESQKRKVAGDDESSGDRFSSSDGNRPGKEVKIKITKKQLEELLCMKEMQGLTLEQVLTQLINGGDGEFEFHQRSWRPELHSIPE